MLASPKGLTLRANVAYWAQHTMRRFLTITALALLCILGLCYGVLCYVAPRIVFYGAYFDDTRGDTAADSMRSMKPVSFTAEDGTVLRGWLRNRGEGAPLVVMYGGNNMNVGDFAVLARLAPESSVLLLNHRGYGESEGMPCEEDIVQDARMALRHFRAQLGQPQHVTLLGFSLGTGVATQVAATERVQQLILACPFDSVIATGCQHAGPLVYLLPMDSFRSDLAAAKVRCPVTIFMGTQDSIIPNERTLNLASCFRNTKVQLHRIESGHNEIFSYAKTQKELALLLLGESER